jgi:hypothetical protein
MHTHSSPLRIFRLGAATKKEVNLTLPFNLSALG